MMESIPEKLESMSVMAAEAPANESVSEPLSPTSVDFAAWEMIPS